MNIRATPKLLFFAGLVISVVAYVIWSSTNNSLAAAILILIGSFTFPAAIMVWLNSRIGDLPASVLANTSMVGGAIGLIFSGLLEMSVPFQRIFSGYVSVGLIEESTKMIFPLALFLGWRYRSLASGLLIGIASGMGFAVMETIGRGLVDLLNNTQDVGYTMLTRGFFTPAGHPAWTGLICAVLWKARIKPEPSSAARVMGIFILAVLLHATWNNNKRIDVPDIVTALMLMVMGTGILWLVFLQFEQAEKECADV